MSVMQLHAVESGIFGARRGRREYSRQDVRQTPNGLHAQVRHALSESLTQTLEFARRQCRLKFFVAQSRQAATHPCLIVRQGFNGWQACTGIACLEVLTMLRRQL